MERDHRADFRLMLPQLSFGGLQPPSDEIVVEVHVEAKPRGPESARSSAGRPLAK